MNKKTVRYFLYFLYNLVVLTSPVLCQSGTTYSIHNITKQDYNAEMQNWDITHDQEGFIYVANNIGLLEFDGVKWTFYSAPNGTVIRSVEIDSKNRIFTSGYRELGFWERDAYGILNYTSLNPLAENLFSENEEFWNILIVDGKVYFHSFTSIFIYDYVEFQLIRPGGIISSIGSINGIVYFHNFDNGLYTIQDSLAEKVISNPDLDNCIVQFILPYNDSGILLGTVEKGLFIYDNGRLDYYLEDWLEYFTSNSINRGLVFDDGRFAIGTLLDGILLFSKSGELLHHFNLSSGLQNNTILGIDATAEQDLWISLDQGIDFISFQSDPSYTIYSFENVGAVYSAALFKGNLYLCTNLGVFFREESNSKADFSFIEGTQGQAWDIKIYDNQLFVGHNNGTFIIEDSKAMKISELNGGMDLIPIPGENSKLLQSTYSNLAVYSKENSEWSHKNSLWGFSELIRYIEFDHMNYIWAGHMRRGIFKIVPGPETDTLLSIEYFGQETFGSAFDIHVFKLENRIVFTTGDSLYTYDDLSDSIMLYRHLNDNLGVYSKSHRIIPGPDHTYWFISKTGIALFYIFENSFEKIKEYPTGIFKDHLIVEYENIFPIDKYTAILCMDNGYAILYADKEDLSNNILGKQLKIKEMGFQSLRGPFEALPVGKSRIKLPYNRNSLYIKFAFPISPNKDVIFQSYVDGLDNAWARSSDVPEFSFERIPPGNYEVYVRAINTWNKSSEIYKVDLKVAYPWYSSKLSILIYVLLLLTAAFIGRYYLMLRIKIRERHIRNVKEKELIRLRNEKLNAELSYRSQELANSTMSIIKKNEFLLKLKSILQNQKEELGTRYPDKYYREVIQRIDRNVSSMDDWKVFEFHFEKAHEKFLNKLMNKYPDLTNGDLRLCAYLRMNLSTKEIAPLLQISIRGVENHRYKLRKKLQLRPEENLTEFLIGF